MSQLTRWDRFMLRLPKWYWDWRIRRLKRWAERNDVPPAPPLDDIMRRIKERKESSDG